MITFERRKADALRKDDKSNVGSLDVKIKGLCERINKFDDFYTTSSCSGRVVLIKGEDKKQEGMFLFRSHDKVKVEEIKGVLEKLDYNGVIIFKQEPCVLAIACKDLEGAGRLLDIAREKAGWKQSGVMTLKNRIIVELRSSENLSLPIALGNKILVDDKYLELLIDEANKRLEKTWEKINRLIKELK